MPPEEFFAKVGNNLALGLNSTVEENAAELLLDKHTAEVLAETDEVLSSDVILYDLPAVLSYDDVVAFLPQVDGVLLIVGSGKTTAKDIKAVEKTLDDKVPLIASILNTATNS